MKYVIIGAVAGGASAAARLRRNDELAEIVIFEKGEYISYANCGLPYYIGNVITNRNALFVQTAASFNKRFNIDVRTQTEVISINRTAKTISARNQTTGEVYEETYDKLVLSPGAEPIRPPLPGIGGKGIFTLRNVADTDYIKAYVQQEQVKKAVVIGAGFIGLEMAENLHSLGMDVTIVEMAGQVLTPVDFPIAAILQQHIRSKGVKLQLNTAVSGFEQTENGQKVMLNNGQELDADVVILSIGVKPDTKLAAEAGLKIGEARGIYVNEYMQTSDPDIYAVGDAIEFTNPITNKSMVTYLAGPANKQGRICADNLVFGHHKKYNGSINTAIVKVFDMTVATAGTASKHLQLSGIKHQVSTITSGSHAGYYPGAKQMTIQIAFTPGDGRLLSAQIVGYDGVDKRLDILSSVIKRNGTIDELTEFEHAYAPPFSSAKDPVNMAAFAAENILLKRSVVFYWNKFDKITPDDVLIDVRTKNEYNAGKILDAINIPVDELRSRLDEIPKDKKIYIYCLGGLRGYLAQRILMQNGYADTINLSGGYQLWNTCNTEMNLI
ncbi:FAD-dependent pyridine nucleotide-disulfide oxidoreductase [Paludibacter propionicigenes WB4]|uniref:FAD-dependent pyridine nucleotide-disulfide oxidoreductase n=1 Tax=Paludibacter propionicigenes (strain DSM 17365 / JCM 13257 / WB4) TaxID=694427 RepID=E4T7H7_PALPW|nr:FAD-dependent oxidoreductase [Paludibacter propionicigenes]ADQ80671.1 FAD-dependent pyridine nucleotide-disulfide oxidoreductase [Paludibacter propionicigenes WB4]